MRQSLMATSYTVGQFNSTNYNVNICTILKRCRAIMNVFVLVQSSRADRNVVYTTDISLMCFLCACYALISVFAFDLQLHAAVVNRLHYTIAVPAHFVKDSCFVSYLERKRVRCMWWTCIMQTAIPGTYLFITSALVNKACM